jgi:hypothetical protein
MKIKNKENWKAHIEDEIYSNDGRTILAFAYLWADMMEREISRGMELKDIIVASFNFINRQITLRGADKRYVECILIDCWEHGDELNYIQNLSIDRVRSAPFDK